jgi:probable selenium-dependent hydroxylase accessory protein YqeC
MLIPQPDNFDALDLSGALFRDTILPAPGIYVGGVAAEEHGKMAGVSLSCLENMLNRFDLILIEADGAAGKPLKGWKETEPVIPLVTTKTIGIVDIQTIGCLIDRSLAHRLEIF